MDSRLGFALRAKQPYPGSQAPHIHFDSLCPRWAETLFSLPAPRKGFIYNPQPVYPLDTGVGGGGGGYAITPITVIHAGGAVATILPNLSARQFRHRELSARFSLSQLRSPGIPGSISQYGRCPSRFPLPTARAADCCFRTATALTFRLTRKSICRVFRKILLLH